MRKLVIAIDGPAAAGKSTTAKLTAERLGYLHVDTGAMYRAMALKVLEEDIDLHDEKRIGKLAEETELRLENDGGKIKVILDGREVTELLRGRAVTNAVSPVSSIKKVREVMVREQRKIGSLGGVVLEGRDIGTVVFPEANLKIFMIADVVERAKRRQKELKQKGVEVDLDILMNEIIERDQKDSKRDISPLKKAEDAIILDTSNLSIDEQVEFIVDKAKKIMRQSKVRVK